ncbi:hypothetical protein GWO69_01285 [Corynebacterium macginleyi]|uniref:hypothetical protein n=1 Tax=Corynebacterium macginleyi TaxID=38290 RepID=UPI001604EC48|nr:hypothetical protein [Corynebacterium macginleyi]MBK4156151.1 hypothetical protein [Corynebacterium macginleyi]
MLTQLVMRDADGRTLGLFPPSTITVGREGDFRIGSDDPYLHRILLQVWWDGAKWLVENRGSSISVRLVQMSSIRKRKTQNKSSSLEPKSEILLRSGASCPLPRGLNLVVFSTPQMEYEISFTLTEPKCSRPEVDTAFFDSPETVSGLKLNFEQRQLLKVLSEKLYRYPGSDDSAIPMVKTLAHSLGWSEGKVNAKLERLAHQIQRSGTSLSKPYRISLARYTYDANLLGSTP